jgi:hypothetical protein
LAAEQVDAFDPNSGCVGVEEHGDEIKGVGHVAVAWAEVGLEDSR